MLIGGVPSSVAVTATVQNAGADVPCAGTLTEVQPLIVAPVHVFRVGTIAQVGTWPASGSVTVSVHEAVEFSFTLSGQMTMTVGW